MSRPLPTDAELAILNLLWAHGPSTVREVHQAIDRGSTGYTTVLKTMQIMAGKGLVERDETQRSHVYRAAINQAPTQKRLVGDLIARAFGGSGASLALSALSASPASKAELAELRALLDRIEKKGGRR